MIKTVKNKIQLAINFMFAMSGFILTIGLSGSLETDRISFAQFFTNILTAACIIFTLYVLLSYANYKLTDYIVVAYKCRLIDDNKHQKSLIKVS